MSISAGAYRGRRLQSPKGIRTRPTSDLLRQAIFNVVGSHVHGAHVLDLFAGTGALGLEALSRGAATAAFAERDRTALVSLRANLGALGVSDQARVCTRNGERFDCVFLDPPYLGDHVARCIEGLAPGTVLRENAVLVVQAFHKTILPGRVGTLARSWERRYGETRLTVYRKESPCP
jgi:16S rRNA (guanine966-N2)-methyltransferase